MKKTTAVLLASLYFSLPLLAGDDSHMDNAKETSGEAWEATKEGSEKAWDATKEAVGPE